MTDKENKPNVVSLKTVPTKEPMDENTEVLLNFLKDMIKYVEQGGISQINVIAVDNENDIDFAIVGESPNPYKTAFVLQNHIPHMYAEICMESDFEEEY